MIKFVKLGKSIIYQNISTLLWIDILLVSEDENEVLSDLFPTMKLVKLGRSE